MALIVNRMLEFVFKRPWLRPYALAYGQWYRNLSGYRKLGLRYDDLLPEETETVQLALKRLPPKEAYDRVFRLRRAFQCSIQHQLLPREEHTKPEEDIPYLTPIIEEIEAGNKEKEDLDSIRISKPSK